MAQHGLVAFFDILGYQNIIEHNLIEEVANIISERLLKLPSDTKAILKKFVDGKDKEEVFNLLLDGIQYRVISDSILLGYDIPAGYKNLEQRFWGVFLLYVAELLSSSFARGLPLRGTIDYGDFILDSNCFAGKPIINCYRLCNCLEFSGCVLTSHCSEVLQALLKLPENKVIKKIANKILLPYLAPLKAGEKKLETIVWTDTETKVGDVRQYIIKGFQAHKKDISRKVYPKIDNTEIMIRCFMERLDALHE